MEKVLVGSNKIVYIMYSFRKENGKTSSRVCRKLGRLDELLERFSNDQDQLMAWAKDTADFIWKNGTVSVSFSKAACIPKNEERSFNVGYLYKSKFFNGLGNAVFDSGNKIVFSDTFILFLARKPDDHCKE